MRAAAERVLGDPDVFRVRIPFVNLGAGDSNCYIVHDAGEWLIVDAGASGVRGRMALLSAFAELGVDFASCRVFLTHAHFDHARLLDEAVPACVEALMSREAFDSRTPEGNAASHDLFARRMAASGIPLDAARGMAAADAEAVSFDASVRPYRFVGDGDTVRVGGCSLSVLGTAGHTADHLCLYDAARGVLFGGDHVLFGVTPSVDACSGALDGLGLYLENLRKTADLSMHVLLPGHGDPAFSGVPERARELARHKEERCEAVCTCVARMPGVDLETIARTAVLRSSPQAWARRSFMSRYYAVLEAFTALQHLCAHGAAERFYDDAWQAYRYRTT